MCLECTAHYKNIYPEVWMSADQPGMKEEILPVFITTIGVKVIVHNNMFQHCMVTNRTVYREATMKIKEKNGRISETTDKKSASVYDRRRRRRRGETVCVAEKWWICIDSFEE